MEAKKQKTRRDKETLVATQLDPITYDKLVVDSEKNERSIASTLRYLIKKYLG